MEVPKFWTLMLAALRKCNDVTEFNAFASRLRSRSQQARL